MITPATLSSRRPYGAAHILLARFPRISSWAIFDSSLQEERHVARGNGGNWRVVAGRVGITRQKVNRLTDLKRATKIDRIDAALRALGKRLYLDAA